MGLQPETIRNHKKPVFLIHENCEETIRWISSNSNGVLSLCDAYRRWCREQGKWDLPIVPRGSRCKWFYLHLSSACSVSQSIKYHKMVSKKSLEYLGYPGVNEKQTAWRKMKGLKSLSLTTRMAIASWKRRQGCCTPFHHPVKYDNVQAWRSFTASNKDSALRTWDPHEAKVGVPFPVFQDFADVMYG